MRIDSAALAFLLLLAGCGSSDPTPAPEEAANAAQINESVEEAVEDQQAAEAVVENREEAENRTRQQ
jgi:predicted small lipoprotein YifL